MKQNRKTLPLYLSESLYRRLKGRALSQGKPVVGVVREALEEYLAYEKGSRVEEGYRKLRGIVGLVKDKPDVSKEHDRYLAEGLKDWPKKNKP